MILKIFFLFLFTVLGLLLNYRYINKWHFIQITIFIFLFFLIIIFLKLSSFFMFENVVFIGRVRNASLQNMLIPNTYFRINLITCVFLIIILIITICTILFSVFYMKQEQKQSLFLSFIAIFALSMIFFLCSGSVFTLLLGWEIIGVSSFLLINFWVQRKLTLNCAFKAFIFNKFSDLSLLIFFIFIMSYTCSGDLDISLECINSLSFNEQLSDHCLLFLLYGVSVKSAQVFLHLWLLDSMEAPVPASAMIHSATLVTAGVYVLFLFSNLFDFFDSTNILLIIGSITGCLFCISASQQTDVKKLLACSTISNCGLMFVTLGWNNSVTALIFMCLHGLFKAGLFYCIGFFIKNYKTQDLRYMGSFSSKNYYFFIIFFFCLLNLIGTPLSIGFFAKNLLLNNIASVNFIIFGLLALTLSCNIFYSYRLIYAIYFDFCKCYFSKDLIKLQLSYTINNYKFFITVPTIFSFLFSFLFIAAWFTYAIFKFLFIDSYITYSIDDRILCETWTTLNIISYCRSFEVEFVYWMFLIFFFECVIYRWFNFTYKGFLFYSFILLFSILIFQVRFFDFFVIFILKMLNGLVLGFILLKLHIYICLNFIFKCFVTICRSICFELMSISVLGIWIKTIVIYCLLKSVIGNFFFLMYLKLFFKTIFCFFLFDLRELIVMNIHQTHIENLHILNEYKLVFLSNLLTVKAFLREVLTTVFKLWFFYSKIFFFFFCELALYIKIKVFYTMSKISATYWFYIIKSFSAKIFFFICTFIDYIVMFIIGCCKSLNIIFLNFFIRWGRCICFIISFFFFCFYSLVCWIKLFIFWAIFAVIKLIIVILTPILSSEDYYIIGLIFDVHNQIIDRFFEYFVNEWNAFYSYKTSGSLFELNYLDWKYYWITGLSWANKVKFLELWDILLFNYCYFFKIF